MSPQKRYLFKVYNGPPSNASLSATLRGLVTRDVREYKPKYLGELAGVTNWELSEEINSLGASGSITMSSVEVSAETEYLDYLLYSGGRPVTTNQRKIAISRVPLSDNEEISFLDQSVDIGHYVRIERWVGRDVKVMFHGQVRSIETSTSSQSVTLRLLSLGYLGGRWPAIYGFGFRAEAGGALPPLPAIQLRFVNPLAVISRVLGANPYIFGSNSINAPAAEINTLKMFTNLETQTTADIVADCYSYLPKNWFLRVNYDVAPVMRQTHQGGDLGVKYTPLLELVKEATTPNYYLTNDLEVQDADVNLSIEDMVTEVVHTTSQDGFYTTSNLPFFGDPNPVVYVDPPDTEDDPYRARILHKAVENSGGLPTHKGKKGEAVGYQQDDPKLVGSDIAETTDSATATPEIRGLLTTLANQDLEANNDSTFIGNVTVVDTPARKIEDYRLGDLVGFRGFNNVVDNTVGKIAAIRRGHVTAHLSLSKPTPNVDRTLQALRADLLNIQRV